MLGGQIVDFSTQLIAGFLQLIFHVLQTMIRKKGYLFVSIWAYTEMETFELFKKMDLRCCRKRQIEIIGGV